MITLSPSVLGADLMRLGEEIEKAERLGIRWLHLDNMDGHFAPNISYGPDFVRAIRKKTDLFLDVHLMLDHPLKYIDTFARAGADMITVHYEAKDDVQLMLRKIRSLGLKSGLSINPHTSPEAVRKYLPDCDLVLVMTVEPGFGGQKLRGYCLDKLPVLRRMMAESGRQIHISVDGGIKMDNLEDAVRAGADVLVMGTGFFKAEHPEELNALLKKLEDEGCGL
ncbi:MAG: ribulose-phosphate 3-epimerase [Clostridia bacterium]|nr:ribulose-phosphate 3-epimerase [Clostridia bacterium]